MQKNTSRIAGILLIAAACLLIAIDQVNRTAVPIPQTILPHSEYIQQWEAHQTQLKEKRVNINTATFAQLCDLPYIGETTAAAILQYRAEHGPFSDLAELQNVPGIGVVTFAQILELIDIS